MNNNILILLICIERVFFATAGFGGSANLTDFLRHRQRRYLIYENGGQLKLVIGPTSPLNIADPITFRSVVISFNLHGGHYTLPADPLYPWDKWEGIFARSMETKQAVWERRQEDDTRLFVYTAMENFLHTRDGSNGRACLLRVICENAQVHQHVGIFSEVLDIVLTPGKELLDPVYQQARFSGLSGADCLQLYAACPKGSCFLDQYLNYW